MIITTEDNAFIDQSLLHQHFVDLVHLNLELLRTSQLPPYAVPLLLGQSGYVVGSSRNAQIGLPIGIVHQQLVSAERYAAPVAIAYQHSVFNAGEYDSVAEREEKSLSFVGIQGVLACLIEAAER